MPLRDHYRPPLLNAPNAESMNLSWATILMQWLNAELPAGYRAEQEVFGGPRVTIDLAALERTSPTEAAVNGTGGTAVAPRTYAPAPVLAAEVSFDEAPLYEVKVYDEDNRTAAAIELVSRSNKDRPVSRRAFAIKCASYLQAGLALVVVDIVTTRRADLHSELVRLLDLPDELHWSSRSGPAALAYRVVGTAEGTRLEAWPADLRVGDPLPEVPLWLAPDLAVPLDLEHTYEAAWNSHRR